MDFSRNLDKAAQALDRWYSAYDVKPGRNHTSYIMDLMAADGVNGNLPIDWDAMLAGDAFDFAHDIVGILRHMDRRTGKLGDCFVPRFAKIDPMDDFNYVGSKHHY